MILGLLDSLGVQRKPQFILPDEPTSVLWESLTANGAQETIKVEWQSLTANGDQNVAVAWESLTANGDSE